MNFDIGPLGQKNTRDQCLIAINTSPATTAASVRERFFSEPKVSIPLGISSSIRFLSSDPNGLRDKLKIFNTGERNRKNSTIITEETVALVYELLHYKCTSKKRHRCSTNNGPKAPLFAFQTYEMFQLDEFYTKDWRIWKCVCIRYSPSLTNTKNTAIPQSYINIAKEDSAKTMTNSYVDLSFDVVQAVTGNRYADRNDIELIKLCPIASFRFYKLTTSRRQ